MDFCSDCLISSTESEVLSLSAGMILLLFKTPLVVFSSILVCRGVSCTALSLFLSRVRLEGNSFSRLLVGESSATLAVSLLSMSTVSPIIPSIDPDRTSFRVSVIEVEVFGVSTVGGPLGVGKFDCRLGVGKFDCRLGAVKFDCRLGAVKFDCRLGVGKFDCRLGAVKFGAVKFDCAF